MKALLDAWGTLSGKGKTIVAVVVVLAFTGLLALAMWLGYNLDWIPGVLAQ